MAVAKHKAAVSSGRVSSKTGRTRIAAVKAKATVQARKIVAAARSKAVERSAAILAKAGVAPRKGGVKEEPTGTPDAKNAHDEHELLWHDSIEVNEAAARGDMSAVHRLMDRQLRGMGLVATVGETHRGVVTVVPNDRLNAMGVAGYRNWNGEVVMSDAAQASLRALGSEAGSRPAGTLLRSHKQKHDSARNQADELLRERLKLFNDHSHNRDNKQRLPPRLASRMSRLFTKEKAALAEAAERHQDKQRIQGGLDDLHVLMHETLHGFSPISPMAYRGHGAQIEEITTEVSARHIMNQRYGAELDKPNAGTYGQQINAATMGIAEAGRVSPEVAYQHLQDASLAFKKKAVRSFNTPELVRTAFSQILGDAMGVPSGVVDAALTRHLDGAKIARTA